MKWIGTKIEQFTTKIYSNLECTKILYVPIAYLGKNLAIGNFLGLGPNVIDFYNEDKKVGLEKTNILY